MGKDMAKGQSLILMVKSMLENGGMIRLMALENTLSPMEKSTRGDGRTVNIMVKGH